MPSTVKMSQHAWTLKPEGHRLNLVIRGPVCEKEAGLADADCREVVLRALSAEGQVDLITLQGTTWRQYEGLPVKVMNHLLVLTRELERLKNAQVPQPEFHGVAVPDGDVDALVVRLKREVQIGEEELEEDESAPTTLPAAAPADPEAAPTAAPERLAWVEKNKGFLRQEITKLDCPKCAFYPAFVFEGLSTKLQEAPETLPTEVAKLAQAIADGKKNLARAQEHACDRCLGVTGAELENLGVKLDEFVQTVGGSTSGPRVARIPGR